MNAARCKALRAEIVEAHEDWSGESTPRRVKLRTLKKWETRSRDRGRSFARYFKTSSRGRTCPCQWCRPWETNVPW